MVQTGGPLATLVGICLLGVVFAVPVSLLPNRSHNPTRPPTSPIPFILDVLKGGGFGLGWDARCCALRSCSVWH
jgi:hypothetical protein